MPPTTTELAHEPSHSAPLLQHLQRSHPKSQIALLAFSDQEGVIEIARIGVPIHIERFEHIGLDLLGTQFLTHSHPDALQAERAIEHIENSIMPAHLDLRQFHVFTADQPAQTLLSWVQSINQQQHRVVNLDTIEACFNLYVKAALDGPHTVVLPKAEKLWAYLILLREAMHHLCIEQIHVLGTSGN